MRHLSDCCRFQDQYKKAMKLAKKALEIATSSLPCDHFDLGWRKSKTWWCACLDKFYIYDVLCRLLRCRFMLSVLRSVRLVYRIPRTGCWNLQEAFTLTSWRSWYRYVSLLSIPRNFRYIHGKWCQCFWLRPNTLLLQLWLVWLGHMRTWITTSRHLRCLQTLWQWYFRCCQETTRKSSQALFISVVSYPISCNDPVCVGMLGIGCCLAKSGDSKAALVHIYPAVSIARKTMPTSDLTATGIYTKVLLWFPCLYIFH